MKQHKHDRIDKVLRIGSVAILLASLCLLGKAIADRVQAKQDGQSEAVETVSIVYTDEQSHTYAALTYPHLLEREKPKFALTDADRETVARIIAGQAVDNTTTCQTMVANVLYNQMLTTGGRIERTEYAMCDRKTPSAQTYEAVDAIFTRGEWLLDDTVLWTDDAENPDAWHQTLRLVAVNDGVAFYEAKQ